MFGGKKTKNNQFASGGHTLFDRAVEIRGSVRFGGTLDIEGTVIGDVIADDGVDAVVRVRDKGAVQGEIRAPQVIINGSVVGDVYSTKHLELASNAVVNGNVHYHVIEMVKGAEVNGSLVHTDGPEFKKAGTETKKAGADSVRAEPETKDLLDAQPAKS